MDDRCFALSHRCSLSWKGARGRASVATVVYDTLAQRRRLSATDDQVETASTYAYSEAGSRHSRVSSSEETRIYSTQEQPSQLEATGNDSSESEASGDTMEQDSDAETIPLCGDAEQARRLRSRRQSTSISRSPPRALSAANLRLHDLMAKPCTQAAPSTPPAQQARVASAQGTLNLSRAVPSVSYQLAGRAPISRRLTVMVSQLSDSTPLRSQQSALQCLEESANQAAALCDKKSQYDQACRALCRNLSSPLKSCGTCEGSPSRPELVIGDKVRSGECCLSSRIAVQVPVSPSLPQQSDSWRVSHEQRQGSTPGGKSCSLKDVDHKTATAQLQIPSPARLRRTSWASSLSAASLRQPAKGISFFERQPGTELRVTSAVSMPEYGPLGCTLTSVGMCTSSEGAANQRATMGSHFLPSSSFDDIEEELAAEGEPEAPEAGAVAVRSVHGACGRSSRELEACHEAAEGQEDEGVVLQSGAEAVNRAARKSSKTCPLAAEDHHAEHLGMRTSTSERNHVHDAPADCMNGAPDDAALDVEADALEELAASEDEMAPLERNPLITGMIWNDADRDSMRMSPEHDPSHGRCESPARLNQFLTPHRKWASLNARASGGQELEQEDDEEVQTTAMQANQHKPKRPKQPGPKRKPSVLTVQVRGKRCSMMVPSKENQVLASPGESKPISPSKAPPGQRPVCGKRCWGSPAVKAAALSVNANDKKLHAWKQNARQEERKTTSHNCAATDSRDPPQHADSGADGAVRPESTRAKPAAGQRSAGTRKRGIVEVVTETVVKKRVGRPKRVSAISPCSHATEAEPLAAEPPVRLNISSLLSKCLSSQQK